MGLAPALRDLPLEGAWFAFLQWDIFFPPFFLQVRSPFFGSPDVHLQHWGISRCWLSVLVAVGTVLQGGGIGVQWAPRSCSRGDFGARNSNPEQPIFCLQDSKPP